LNAYNGMNGTPEIKANGMRHRQNLKELLIQQYLLHEVEHHPFHTIHGGGPTPAEPRAHTLVDIYKCLHQGEFGVAHTIDDPGRFRDRLYHELLESQPRSDEPVLENVAVDGTIMRLNLRPYRALFGDDTSKACDLLAEACLRSADIPKGSSERFLSVLYSFKDLNSAGELVVGNVIYVFPTEMVKHFLMQIRELARRMGEIPVFSHSPNYRQLNAPSYRVVDISVIQQSSLVFIFDERNKRQP